MEHLKSRKSVSKRSSILKAPVVQQSSQNAKSDVSLYQESPAATKQKRRVSFAGKKHVKEFCDSVEQGTVWDITYEESSVEHTGQIELNNQYYKTINNDHHERNDGKETNENETVTNKSLDLTEPISTMGSLRPICAEETLIQKSISIVCQNTNKNEANHSILIKSNSNIGVPADKNIMVYNDASSLNDIENTELNQTCVQDISMEVTEIPYVIRSQNIVPMTHKQLLEDKENIPMGNTISKFDVLPTTQNEVNMMSDKTQYFCTERLEFTECLQFVTKLPELQPKSIVSQYANKDVNNQKTPIFQNTSMEITGAIPLNQNKDSIDQTVIFHDTSMDNAMEVTPIVNKQRIRKIFQNESMAITAPLHMPNILQRDIPQLNDVTTNLLRNKEDITSSNTKIFQNESMAITAPLHMPNILQRDIPKLNDVTTNVLRNNEDITSSNTKIFQNESMAITAPLHMPNILQHDIPKLNDVTTNVLRNNEDITSSNTKIFQNESMAITAPLHMPNILQRDIPQLNDVTTNVLRNNEDITSSNTKIFQNESMAITAPLHMPNILQRDIPKLNDVTTNVLRNNEDITSSSTKIFQNESMAITAPLHMTNVLQRDIPKLNDVIPNALRSNEDIMSLNTKVFQNMSMEITSAITNLPILGSSEKLSESTEEDYANLNKNEKKYKATVSNKSVHELVNDTLYSGTMNYIEDFEDSSTEPQPLNGLTSLISSFVYADMIEEDSFVKAINEDELQSTKSDIVQETKSQQSNVNTKSIVDTNVEVINIQSPDKCITRNEDTTKEHENIQENNVIVNTEENNQCDPRLFLSKSNEIHENIFENCTNHETISNITTEKEISRRNKQLNETKKDVERNSATYIIKSKKNLDMDIDKYIDDHSINNQISHKSFTLSPTSLFTSNKNKMCTTENNLIADVTDNINFNDSDVKENSNDSSLNEKVNHVALHEKPEESSTFQKGTFSSLIQQLKMYMHSNDCIWDLCHEDIDKQMLVVSFISASLLVVIFTQNDVNTATCVIKRINIISRLKDDEKNVQLSIAHKLIKEKINVEHINQLFKYDEDVVPLLNHISEDVKSVLDFVFDLQKLDDTNLMKINSERITFIVRSKCMNILLEVTVDVKLFDTINSSDINIVSILGTVRKEDIKKLIINIKRDYKFLRRYMSDIKAYIDIIEQADLANKKSCS